mgnify:CR=1 FL=1
MDTLYLIHGEEKKLVKDAQDEILKKILDDDAGNNVSWYNMQNNTLDEIIADACMMSLFGDKKVIVCKECVFLSSLTQTEDEKKLSDDFVKYLDNPSENTVIILTLTENKLDERKKIVKEIKKRAKIISCQKLSGNDLFNCAKEFLNEQGYKYEQKALRLLVDRIENNLELLHR